MLARDLEHLNWHAANGNSPTGFAVWQRRYAECGVATFPVAVDASTKKPMITNYGRVGLRGSEQLVLKFPEAAALGFMAGRRNRLTIVDLDSTDEAIVTEGERLFGSSPLLWITGSGKFATAFRYNGESRLIRPIANVPIDVLGGGLVVAPGSMGARRPYEIIRGSLDDLDRLPTARIPEEIARQVKPATRPARPETAKAEQIPDGIRHEELFRYCRRTAAFCDDVEQLIDAATTWADHRLAKIPDTVPVADVVRTCKSVWKYREGHKLIGHSIVDAKQYATLSADLELLGFLAVLRAENGPRATFMVADGMAAARGWPRRVVPRCRKKLLHLGIIERVKGWGDGSAARYRWAVPQE